MIPNFMLHNYIVSFSDFFTYLIIDNNDASIIMIVIVLLKL